MNQIIFKTFIEQSDHEKKLSNQIRKDNGIFFTSEIKVIDSIIDVIDFNNEIFNKKILEPSVGNGIFLLRIIEKAYYLCQDKEKIFNFIEKSLYFIDIDLKMIEKTKENISNLYKNFFDEDYNGKFNSFVYDFTEKVKNDLTLFTEIKNHNLEILLKDVDYVIGNPPYVTLYGKRDRKKNEEQRVKYLSEYRQFPKSLKNGKINYIMLFIEHGLEYLKENGKMSFIIDISFFETAYKFTRKFLLENTKINSLEINISNFHSVASGQLIIKIQNISDKDNTVKIKNFITGEIQEINQVDWINEKDEYKFRLKLSDSTLDILDKINEKSPKRLQDSFNNKELRTCTMLLDRENEFVSREIENTRNCKNYKYYQGSKSLYEKYCIPFSDKYFYYDKKLQDEINDCLREELFEKGIKNKKRIGLGSDLVYENPKIYIRQSSKEIVATYDENLSAANNSLYVFSLKSRDPIAKDYLKFLCGYLNSMVTTFYAQKMEIIRYRKGKQPQLKISDLYTVPIPDDIDLQKEISKFVQKIYENPNNKDDFENIINKLIFDFYNLEINEIDFIKTSISDFLKS
jgi:tRNA1(Val) A37 N6-methylase TrmN6